MCAISTKSNVDAALEFETVNVACGILERRGPDSDGHWPCLENLDLLKSAGQKLASA